MLSPTAAGAAAAAATAAAGAAVDGTGVSTHNRNDSGGGGGGGGGTGTVRSLGGLSQQSALGMPLVPIVAGTVTHAAGVQAAAAGGAVDSVTSRLQAGGSSSMARTGKGDGGSGAGGGGRAGEAGFDDGGPLYPAQEAMRRMMVQIDTSDPYPCVLGIPVKPALFATSKVYVFGCFAVISTKLMYDVVSNL